MRYLPPSDAVATYVVLVAPAITEHPAGTVVKPDVMGDVQRSQLSGVDVAPVQVPRVAVQVDPTAAEPETVGVTVFIGGAAVITPDVAATV